jgi:Ala-tRNA(Pro) deacylase
MSIAETVRSFLYRTDVPYRLVRHDRTATSQETAQAAHVSGDRVAKGVVLDDGEMLLLAVIPASHRLDPVALSDMLERRVHLVDEGDFETVFGDCRAGAVPPIGQAYGLATVVDETLVNADEVYFEGGDHETLVRVDRPAFQRIMTGVPRGSFSYHV